MTRDPHWQGERDLLRDRQLEAHESRMQQLEDETLADFHEREKFERDDAWSYGSYTNG